MTKDLNKDILSIQYNVVYVFLKNGDRHGFLSDYDGNKLYANDYDGDNNTYYERYYCEDMYYQNWKLNRINLESGYVSMPYGQFHFYAKTIGQPPIREAQYALRRDQRLT